MYTAFGIDTDSNFFNIFMDKQSNNEKSLAHLLPGEQAQVLSIKGNGAITRRLMEMGIVPGAPVRLIKAAPLGDPLEIRVRDYHLALRQNEARTIIVSHKIAIESE